MNVRVMQWKKYFAVVMHLISGRLSSCAILSIANKKHSVDRLGTKTLCFKRNAKQRKFYTSHPCLELMI